MLARTESWAAVIALLRVGKHSVSGRFDRGTTGAGSVLLPSPLDKFGHCGEMPSHEANAGLSGPWSQVLEGAAKHVA